MLCPLRSSITKCPKLSSNPNIKTTKNGVWKKGRLLTLMRFFPINSLGVFQNQKLHELKGSAISSQQYQYDKIHHQPIVVAIS